MPEMRVRTHGRRATLLILGLLAAALCGCANRILLRPTTNPLETPAARRVIRVGEADLELWTLRAQDAPEGDPKVYVLSLIGKGDRAELRAVAESELWRRQPAEIWALNYPGYGGSSGPSGLDRIPPAALAAFDEIRQAAAGRPVLVSGSSLGAAAALWIAARRPVDGVVLRNPPPLRELILGRHGWWNLWLGAWIVTLQIPDELDSLANGRKAAAPAVFILSRDDRIVPPAYQQEVVEAYAGEKTVIPVEGGHSRRPAPGDLEILNGALRRLAERPR